VMGLLEIGSEVSSKVHRDGFDLVSIDLDFLAPQPSSFMLLAQDSIKFEWSSPAMVSTVIGSVAFGAFHSRGFPWVTRTIGWMWSLRWM
jgi:hypothetical protein